jgi:exopolysaccharide biosynthesis polyprenyl glycosylphosphotransferase
MSTATSSRVAGPREKHEVRSDRARALRARVAVLLTWDIVVVLALFAVLAPFAGRTSIGGAAAEGLGFESLATSLFAVLGLYVTGFYRPSPPGGSHGFARLLAVSLSVSWVVWVLAALLGHDSSLAQAAAVSVLAPAGWFTGRVLAASALATPQRVLLLGSGVVARRVIDVAAREPSYRLEIIGVLDDDSEESMVNAPLLGSLRDLPLILERTQVDRVIVAFSRIADQDLSDILRSCDEHRVELDVVPRLFDVVGPQPSTRSLGGLPVLGVSRASDKRVQRAAKRAGDIVVAATLLLLVSPLFAAIALAVKLGDGGPVFFSQLRVGQQGRLFRCAKFRTMVPDAEKLEADHAKRLKEGDADIAAIVRDLKSEERDPRVTRIGDLLRRTSLDELPQLWNVLVGQMSLVGPRPLRPFEVEALKGWQQTRQSVRPGITGLWQVLGRSGIDWDERMQLDYDYARHWSLALDLEILAKTARVVVLRRGAT